MCWVRYVLFWCTSKFGGSPPIHIVDTPPARGVSLVCCAHTCCGHSAAYDMAPAAMPRPAQVPTCRNCRRERGPRPWQYGYSCSSMMTSPPACRLSSGQKTGLCTCLGATRSRRYGSTQPSRTQSETCGSPAPSAPTHSLGAASGCQRLDDLAGRDHLRLARKDALGQEVVDVSILIGAAILHDDQTVVQICSSAYRREHHTA